MSKKHPGFYFYPGDWMKDPNLRICSIGARGLWLDMLCLMFESARRGYLQVCDSPMSLEQLARATGCSTDETTAFLRELESSGVFSRTEHGTIYSRRLVRYDQLLNARAVAGSKGGSKTQAKRKATTKANGKLSYSSSTSFSSSPPTPALPAERPDELQRQVEVVMKRVADRGVGDAKGCVQEAIDSGVSLDEIMAILNHYDREGGNKPVALHQRIAKHFPGQEIEQGWLPDWRPVSSPASAAAKASEMFYAIQAILRRLKGKSQAEIDAALVAAGIDPKYANVNSPAEIDVGELLAEVTR